MVSDKHQATTNRNWKLSQPSKIFLSEKDFLPYIDFNFYYLMLLKYIIDLQCCINFWCTAKWFYHVHISFPKQAITEHGVGFSVLHTQQVPVDYPVHIQQCAHTKPKPSIHPSSPLVAIKFVFEVSLFLYPYIDCSTPFPKWQAFASYLKYSIWKGLQEGGI